MKTLCLKLRLSLIILLFLPSCRIHLVAPYSAALSARIDSTYTMVDRFYLQMLEKTTDSAEGRAYSKFTDDYINIEVELNSLYMQNRIRPLNKNSTRIAQIALQKWIDYKEEHKKRKTISDAAIRLNRRYMADLFYTMRVAEEAKQE